MTCEDDPACDDRVMTPKDHPSILRTALAVFMRRKFTFLLIMILVLNVTRSITVNNIEDQLILDMLSALLQIAATLSVCVEKRSRLMALTLGTPAILLGLFQRLIPDESEVVVTSAARLSSMIFVGFIIAVIIRILMTQPEVTRDSIAGAFCGYILIGVMFTEAFCLLDDFDPHSFQFSTLSQANQNDPLQRWLMLQYYSFTSLTTLGIGDVLPLTPVARGVTMWEVVSGQFYLAVLVAGIVNLRGAATLSEKEHR